MIQDLKKYQQGIWNSNKFAVLLHVQCYWYFSAYFNMESRQLLNDLTV